MPRACVNWCWSARSSKARNCSLSGLGPGSSTCPSARTAVTGPSRNLRGLGSPNARGHAFEPKQIDLVVVATLKAIQVTTTTKSIAAAVWNGDAVRRGAGHTRPRVELAGSSLRDRVCGRVCGSSLRGRVCGRRGAPALAECVNYSGWSTLDPRMEPQHDRHGNA